MTSERARWSFPAHPVFVGLGALAAVVWAAALVDDVGLSIAAARVVVCWALLGAGAVAARRAPAAPTGALMAFVGLLFAGAAATEESLEPWRYTIGLGFSDLWLGALVWLVLSFPNGRLETFPRRFLGAAALLLTVGWKPAELAWTSPGAACWDCPPAGNVWFVGKPPLDLAAWDARIHGAILVALALAVGVVLARFVASSAPARRTQLPLLLPAALLVAKLILDEVWLLDRYAVYPADELMIVTAPNALVLAAIPIGFIAGASRTSGWQGAIGRLLGDLEAQQEDLSDALARALGDPSLRVGFWSDALGHYVDAAGEPLEIPAEEDRRRATTLVSGERGRLAALVHDRALLDQRGLLDSATRAARFALENARLAAEVRAQLAEVTRSRSRIVEAGDRERRRLERDLHDGAQQRLVSLRIALRMVRTAAAKGDPAQLDAMLDEVDAQARDAITELRDLSRGIHPPLLAEEGLGPALEALAERATLDVEVRSVPQKRLPETLEVAAYFVCSEALANAAKHSGAARVVVQAGTVDGRFELAVRDDGLGGATMSGGSGLRGLSDRVAAVGGRLGIESAPGEGTTLRVTVPLNGTRPT